VRLASAWHKRVLEDEVVSHAFSHGYRAEHTSALRPIGRRRSAARRRTPIATVMRRPSCGCTAATGRTRRWTSARLLVSIRRWRRRPRARRARSGARCTIIRVGHHDHDVSYHHSADEVRVGCTSEMVLGWARRLTGASPYSAEWPFARRDAVFATRSRQKRVRPARRRDHVV